MRAAPTGTSPAGSHRRRSRRRFRAGTRAPARGARRSALGTAARSFPGPSDIDNGSAARFVRSGLYHRRSSAGRGEETEMRTKAGIACLAMAAFAFAALAATGLGARFTGVAKVSRPAAIPAHVDFAPQADKAGSAQGKVLYGSATVSIPAATD